MSLEKIAALSAKYGADPAFVIAGGGNTSYKDENFLYVKPSGVALAGIKPEYFVKMDLAVLKELFTDGCEACADAILKKAVVPGQTRRPSIEAPLHTLMPFHYVVHLHPSLTNGLTCAKDGKGACAKLFPEALWVDYARPGYPLSKAVNDALKSHGGKPNVIFLQNHGVFFGADTPEEVEKLIASVDETLVKAYAAAGVCTKLDCTDACDETVRTVAPKLRTLLGSGEGDQIVRKFVNCAGVFQVAEGPFTPDHVVFNRSAALVSENPDREAVDAFHAQYGFAPLVVSVPGKGVFCAGNTLDAARNASALAENAALIRQLSAAFGGPNYITSVERTFLENWEAEKYRYAMANTNKGGRLSGKVAVVTGAAQGFGYGIAEELAREGAVIVIADLNLEGAKKAAETIGKEYPSCDAFAVAVNVANEDSVSAMVTEVAKICGGIDLFVSNAGVVKAGSVKEITLKDWEFVTDINYNGYFICVKHVARLMSAQTADGGDWLDIVQVNSKSGLQGSNKNGAYAGSKFGGMGLTQSFAMELVADRIKVNSVCPGNFFDGPLWSNPEKGLFVQYLKSGKVPGAKTVADVKRFYEAKIPMNRGCFPKDVARAILYAVEQKYETGQAIPVTGGQVMLK